jgi:hypothetical protein
MESNKWEELMGTRQSGGMNPPIISPYNPITALKGGPTVNN